MSKVYAQYCGEAEQHEESWRERIHKTAIDREPHEREIDFASSAKLKLVTYRNTLDCFKKSSLLTSVERKQQFSFRCKWISL
eukprot:6203626-Pleurochrysis_carterae.AAC.1